MELQHCLLIRTAILPNFLLFVFIMICCRRFRIFSSLESWNVVPPSCGAVSYSKLEANFPELNQEYKSGFEISKLAFIRHEPNGQRTITTVSLVCACTYVRIVMCRPVVCSGVRADSKLLVKGVGD